VARRCASATHFKASGRSCAPDQESADWPAADNSVDKRLGESSRGKHLRGEANSKTMRGTDGLGNVLHIDLAFPLMGDRNINKAQFLIQTKASY
jgi:hypothetical protein